MNDVSQRAAVEHEQEMDFIDLWWLMWDYRVQIAIVAAICVGLALVLALTATPLYRATVMLTEVKENGLDSGQGLGGEAAGLASLAGLTVGQQHPERSAVLRSRHLVEEFVQKPDVYAGVRGRRERSGEERVDDGRALPQNVLDIRRTSSTKSRPSPWTGRTPPSRRAGPTSSWRSQISCCATRPLKTRPATSRISKTRSTTPPRSSSRTSCTG